MHDIFLAEKISNVVVALCWKQRIEILEELVVGANPGSHLDEMQLLELIRDKKPTLVDADTRIRIERDMPDDNAAEIRSLRGRKAPVPENRNAGD